MEEKKINKTPKCGFACTHTYEGQTGFDEYYVNKEIKQYCEKTGEGKYDYIIKAEVVETKEPIKEVVNSQAADVGIEAYMRACAQEGIDPNKIEVSEDGPINDYTNCPEDLAGAIGVQEAAKKKFEQLPKDLVGDRTYEEFVNSKMDELYQNWLNKNTVKKENVEPVKKEGE